MKAILFQSNALLRLTVSISIDTAGISYFENRGGKQSTTKEGSMITAIEGWD